MDRFQCRKKARAVAKYDLNGTILAVVMCVVLLAVVLFFVSIYGGSAVYSAVVEVFEHFPREIKELWLFTWPLEIKCAIGASIAILIIIQLWAATKLVDGTDKGREASDALGLCTIWRNVCIFSVICGCLLMFLIFGIGWFTAFMCVIKIIERGCYLFFVYKFIMELGTRNVPECDA